MADEPDENADATISENNNEVIKWDTEDSYGIYCVESLKSAHALERAILKGTNVNIQDLHGMTALHHAALIGARPCIRVLVKYGRCDYLIQDNKGRYASDLAIEWARDYAVGRLLTKHQLKQAHERGVPAWVPSGPA